MWGPGRGSMVPLWWELKEAISSSLLRFQSNRKQNVKQEERVWNRHLGAERGDGLETGGKPAGQASGPTWV